MHITLLTEKGLDDLKEICLQHIDIYQANGTMPTNMATFEYPDLILAGSYPVLKDASSEEPLWQTDCENSLTIFRFFGNNQCPISLMSDERYMAHLTNYEYFEYMKKRWPIEGRYLTGRIKSQYFFNRAPNARNGILRLFWPAYLIAQANRNQDFAVFERKLQCFFKNRIALDRILERNFSRNEVLLDCCLDAILLLDDHSNITGNKRSGLLGKNINNILSVTSLDSMGREAAFEIVNNLVKDIASGAYDSERKDDEDKDADEDEKDEDKKE